MPDSPRLLTIEDESTVRRSIAAYFEDSGFVVLQAENGRVGIEVFQREMPDVVLCDLRMPEMDGLGVLERLAATSPETPFIVVSGTGDMGDAIQALKLGAWDYVTKPIQDMAVLEHSVRKSLERARLLRENREYSEHLESTNRKLNESLRQLQEDEAAARAIQFQLLPQEAVLRQHQFERYLKTSTMLSGDFLDYFLIDDRRIGFYFADVSGHGVSSAFITVLLNTTMNHLRDRYARGEDEIILHPERVLKELNDDLLRQSLGKYLTMCYVVIDEREGTMTWCNGGHFPHPVLVTDGDARFLEEKNVPVGLFARAEYKAAQIELPASFIFAMFSDGIFDILGEESLRDKKARLLELASIPGVSKELLIEALNLKEIESPPDDITLLLLKKEA